MVYSKYEATSFNADIPYNNIFNNFKSFEHKDKLILIQTDTTK